MTQIILKILLFFTSKLKQTQDKGTERERQGNKKIGRLATSLSEEVFNSETFFYTFFYTKIDLTNTGFRDWSTFSGIKAFVFRNGVYNFF